MSFHVAAFDPLLGFNLKKIYYKSYSSIYKQQVVFKELLKDYLFPSDSRVTFGLIKKNFKK